VRAPSLVLYLHAPKQLLIHRLMQRGLASGRADDNMETINKRLVTFKKESVPVVSYYEGTRSTVVKKVGFITIIPISLQLAVKFVTSFRLKFYFEIS